GEACTAIPKRRLEAPLLDLVGNRIHDGDDLSFAASRLSHIDLRQSYEIAQRGLEPTLRDRRESLSFDSTYEPDEFKF
ncbi:hypothetical protein ACC736_39825, partial [Rhizobium ruizarguesonis]